MTSLALIFGFVTAAVAQSGGAADDQYGGQTTTATTPTQTTAPTTTTAPVSGSGSDPATVTTSTTPTTTPTGTTTTPTSTTPTSRGTQGDDGGGAVKGADDGRGSDDRGSSPSSAGTGTGTVGDGLPSGCATRAVYIHFGIAPRALRDDVFASVRLAGFEIRYEGPITRRRFDAFLDGSLPSQFSGDGPRAVGRALGAQMVPTSAAQQRAFPVLFGTREFHGRVPTDLTAIRVVLTRRDDLDERQVAFMEGVAAGLQSTGIPVAYAERSGHRPSHVAEFAALGVPGVDDVDTAAGQLRLAKLIYGRCTQDGVLRAVAPEEVRLDPSAAITAGTDGGSGGRGALALLAGLLCVGGLGTAAAMRRRARG